MMPVIRISDGTYEKLQALAKPFVDTPEAVISRLADAALEGTLPLAIPNLASTPTLKKLKPDAPGSLTHTKLRFARIDDQIVHQPNWNKLSRTAHAMAMNHIPLDVLRHISDANIRSGRHENEGFAYLADADISIQGQDSVSAWQSSHSIARELGVAIEVVVEWYNKEGAAFPGEQRKISWAPE